MAETEGERKRKQDMLKKVEKGMPVYDRDGESLGTVEHVHHGHPGSELSYTGGGTLQGVKPGEDDDILANIVEEMFDPGDQIHKEMQQELYLHGYVKLLTEHLDKGDRYIKPDHIEQVSDKGVHLNVSKQDLKEKGKS